MLDRVPMLNMHSMNEATNLECWIFGFIILNPGPLAATN